MAKRSAKRRRRKNILPAVILAAILAIAVYLLLDNYVFVVRDIEVIGAQTMGAEDVIRLAQLPIGKPLRQVREEKVRRALESTGRVALESLQTKLPNRVLLTVRERRQAALVQNAGQVLALDSDGVVIAQYQSVPEESSVYVTGLNVRHFALGSQIGGDSQAVEDMVAVLRALQAVDAEALVSELNVADSQQLYFYSRTGIQVMLGSNDNMERKLQWMKSALLDLEGRGETRGRLDVSSGNKADFLPR